MTKPTEEFEQDLSAEELVSLLASVQEQIDQGALAEDGDKGALLNLAPCVARRLEQPRSAHVERKTKETDITIDLTIDGFGKTNISTGVPFFDHMMEAFGRHGLFDLTIDAKGDIEIDAHHTVEDVGIVLGQAFAQAMGDKKGIVRFASKFVPMDETLVLAAVDISGRGQLHYDVEVPIEIIGTFDTSLAKEFMIAFATNAGVTLHIKGFKGENSHHIIEAVFKALGRVMCEALTVNPRIAEVLPSTKGAL